MNVSIDTFFKPVVYPLSVVGKYFYSPDRFRATFNIAGVLAKEWADRHPYSNLTFEPFIEICSALNISYLGESISRPFCYKHNPKSWFHRLANVSSKCVRICDLMTLLERVEIINFSKLASHLGKISGYPLTNSNQVNIVQCTIAMSIVHSFLNCVIFSRDIIEAPNHCSIEKLNLFLSLVEISFYSFIFIAPSYKALNRTLLIRVAIVIKELSLISIDLKKEKLKAELQT